MIFIATGSCSIIRTDNANINTVNSSASLIRMTWKEKATIIKSQLSHGEIVLSESADSLATESLKIETE